MMLVLPLQLLMLDCVEMTPVQILVGMLLPCVGSARCGLWLCSLWSMCCLRCWYISVFLSFVSIILVSCGQLLCNLIWLRTSKLIFTNKKARGWGSIVPCFSVHWDVSLYILYINNYIYIERENASD